MRTWPVTTVSFLLMAAQTIDEHARTADQIKIDKGNTCKRVEQLSGPLYKRPS